MPGHAGRHVKAANNQSRSIERRGDSGGSGPCGSVRVGPTRILRWGEPRLPPRAWTRTGSARLPPRNSSLQAISIYVVDLLFDARRVAEISRGDSRPRTAQDDFKAAQFLKARQQLSRAKAGPTFPLTRIVTAFSSAARSSSRPASTRPRSRSSSSGSCLLASTRLGTSLKGPIGLPCSQARWPPPRSSRLRCMRAASTGASLTCPPPSSPDPLAG